MLIRKALFTFAFLLCVVSYSFGQGHALQVDDGLSHYSMIKPTSGALGVIFTLPSVLTNQTFLTQGIGSPTVSNAWLQGGNNNGTGAPDPIIPNYGKMGTLDNVDLSFITGGLANVRMTILASNGNVGIGDLAPSSPLSVKKITNGPVATFANTSGTDYAVVVLNGTGTGGYLSFQNSGSQKAFIYTNGTTMNLGTESGSSDVVLYSNATERMRILGGGDININNLSGNTTIGRNGATTNLNSTTIAVPNIPTNTLNTNVMIRNGNNMSVSTLTFLAGGGTLNTIPKWTPDGVTLGDSKLTDNGTILAYNGTTINLVTATTATTGYQIAGATILHNTGTTNTFVGLGSGSAIAGGAANTAVGSNALNANSTGPSNTAVGTNALLINANGANNTAVGVDALRNNVGGNSNIAIGGAALLKSNTNDNVGVGFFALSNTTGAGNIGLGTGAGGTNTVGTNNTFLGLNANASVNNLTNATAIGAGAIVGASNSLVLGNAVTVGIGTSSPAVTVGKLDVVGTGAISQYGISRVSNSNAGGLGGTLGISNPNGGVVGTAAAIGFDVDGTTLWTAGGVNATNAEIRAINMNAGSNATDLAFSTWTGAGEFEGMRLQSNGTLLLNNLPASASTTVVTSNAGVLESRSIASIAVTGSGTQNTLPKWNNAGGTTLGNSLLSDNATTLTYTGTGGLKLSGNLTMTTAANIITNPGTEMIVEQTGAGIGPTRIRLQNINASNGMVLEQSSANNVVDLGMKPGSGVQSNLRLEARNAFMTNPASNTNGEFQFYDDALGGGATKTFSIGKSTASFFTNVGIGTATPAAPLSFGGSAGKKIYLYDATATDRYGFGINTSELQTFMTTGAHFSWNKGGDFQPSGTNELMRLTSVGNLQNTGDNPLAQDGNGINNTGFQWEGSGTGFTGNFSNLSAVNGADGIQIAMASNTGNGRAIDVTTGTNFGINGGGGLRSEVFRVMNNGITFSGGANPNANNTNDLGTPALQWRDLYISGIGHFNAVNPNVDNTNDLGTPTFRWRSLYAGTSLLLGSSSYWSFTPSGADLTIASAFDRLIFQINTDASGSGEFTVFLNNSATPMFQVTGNGVAIGNGTPILREIKPGGAPFGAGGFTVGAGATASFSIFGGGFANLNINDVVIVTFDDAANAAIAGGLIWTSGVTVSNGGGGTVKVNMYNPTAAAVTIPAGTNQWFTIIHQ